MAELVGPIAKTFVDHNLLTYAAAIAFQGLVALVPMSLLGLGILAVLPVVFLGLVPREIVPAAYWISDAFPFAHAARFFASALYDRSPWEVIVREAAWLIGLGAVFFALARTFARRLAV